MLAQAAGSTIRQMITAFVSGHLDATDDEFVEHYAPAIRAHRDARGAFVVADARGADQRAQRLLLELGSRQVTVFHMLDAPRANLGDWPTRGGFSSDQARDEALTAASDFDIAWVRPGRERSGTAKNVRRRLASGPAPT